MAKSVEDTDFELIRSLYREIVKDKKKTASERMKAAESLKATYEVNAPEKPKNRGRSAANVTTSLTLT